MGLFDYFNLEKRLEQKTSEITQTVAQEVVKHVDASFTKAQTGPSPFITGLPGGQGVKRYQFTQDMINGGIQRKKKPGSNISFETLRSFSVNHEVSRACINYRKRQISAMEWAISTAEHEDKGNYDTQKEELKQFFKNIGGRGIGYRKFMDRFIEDLMVLDAVSLEKQRTRSNGLYNLVPIDAATIRLRVDESGAMPEPPEAAFVQVIRGQVTAEFTADEMIYELMNPRNDTPYGLAPLESLMIIVSSSLKAGMYNLGYLTDGNVPEGLFTLPDTWQPNQIKEFQEYFDALMAGDEAMTRRLKFMPNGDYTPTNKPTDMAFQEFNDWLMKITCALFEVSPMEIGFSPKSGLGGKGFSESQQLSTENKGLLPLALFIEEIFTTIIQEEFGFTNLKFDFPTLREKDAKLKAETNAILINSGQRTVDELRTDDGLDAIGADKPFVVGQITFIDEESRNEQANAQALAASQLRGTDTSTDPRDKEEQSATPGEDAGAPAAAKRDSGDSFARVISLREEQIKELRTFRKYAVNRFKSGKPIRPFISESLPLDILEVLNDRVLKTGDLTELRKSFEEPIKDLELMSIDIALEARKKLAVAL